MVLCSGYKKESGIEVPKKFIVFLDVMIVLALLNNVGALALTNALVMKENIETIQEGEKIVFKEQNPLTREIHNLEGPETEEKKTRGLALLSGVWLHSFGLALIGAGYLFQRFKKIKRKSDMFWMIWYVLFFYIFTLTDLMNNFGYWIGMKLFG